MSTEAGGLTAGFGPRRFTFNPVNPPYNLPIITASEVHYPKGFPRP